jgi:hypothetical protein
MQNVVSQRTARAAFGCSLEDATRSYREHPLPGFGPMSFKLPHAMGSAKADQCEPSSWPSDPELEALPKPRRPWRRFTLLTLAITAACSLWVGHQLQPQVVYALQSFAGQRPMDLRELGGNHGDWIVNGWVRASGHLLPDTLGFRRPFEDDSFILARFASEPRIWVELRVPERYASSGYVPPESFVGRLAPLDGAGLGHVALRRFLRAHGEAGGDVWLLVDGETPASLRWALAVVVMLFGFAGFSLFSLWRILRPARG